MKETLGNLSVIRIVFKSEIRSGVGMPMRYIPAIMFAALLPILLTPAFTDAPMYSADLSEKDTSGDGSASNPWRAFGSAGMEDAFVERTVLRIGDIKRMSSTSSSSDIVAMWGLMYGLAPMDWFGVLSGGEFEDFDCSCSDKALLIYVVGESEEQVLTVDTDRGTLDIYLPGTGECGNILYVANDGSTYFSRRDNSSANSSVYPDILPQEAIQHGHLARPSTCTHGGCHMEMLYPELHAIRCEEAKGKVSLRRVNTVCYGNRVTGDLVTMEDGIARNCLIQECDADEFCIEGSGYCHSDTPSKYCLASEDISNQWKATEFDRDSPWLESYFMKSLADEYRVNRDMACLYMLVDHIERVMAVRDDKIGFRDYRGEIRAGWSTAKHSEDKRTAWRMLVNNGAILYALVGFVDIVYGHPELHGKRAGGMTLKQKAEGYLDEAERVVAEYNARWFEEASDETNVKFINRNEGYYTFPPSPQVWANAEFGVRNHFLPHNMQLMFGKVLILLYSLTGKESYLNKATRLANTFRNDLTRVEDRYWWTYFPRHFNYALGGKTTEDCGHGIVDFEFAVLAEQHGIVFTSVDILMLKKGLSDICAATSGLMYRIIRSSGHRSGIGDLPIVYLHGREEVPINASRRLPVFVHGMPVFKDDVINTGVISLHTVLTYDGTIIRPLGVLAGGALTEVWEADFDMASGEGAVIDTLKISLSKTQSIFSGSGTLFSIHVEPAEGVSVGASTPLHFESCRINGDERRVDTRDGVVCITKPIWVDAKGEEIQGVFGEDNSVGLDDFLSIVEMFGKSSEDVGFEAKYDLDGDGRVGMDDLSVFIANFGRAAVNY